MSEPVDQYRHKVRDDSGKHEEAETSYSKFLYTSPPSERLKKSATDETQSDFSGPGVSLWEESVTDPATAYQEEPAATLEEDLERELSESIAIGKTADGTGVDDPDKRFQKACFNLINSAREEFGHERPGSIEDDFARFAEENRDAVDTTAPRDFYSTTPGQNSPATAGLPPDTAITAIPQSRPRSVATGMTVVLLAIGMTGALLDVHEHPIVQQSLSWGDQSPETQDEFGKLPRSVSAALSANVSQEQREIFAARSDSILIASASRPVVPVAASISKEAERLSQGDEDISATDNSDEKLDVLKVNLKMTESYLNRLKQSIEGAKPDQLQPLQNEATMVQQEIEELRSQLVSLQPKPDVENDVLLTPSINAFAPVTNKPNAGSAAISRVIDQAATAERLEAEKTETRDPRKVETAMAGTPGLKQLDNLQRNELRQKLVAGECLVPALTSVFPQVPVLVMRDMVRQLDQGC